MHTAIRRLIAGIALATLIACTPGPPASTVTSVTIDDGDRTIVLGDTPTLTATVEATGAATTVTWTSSNESVATIDADGDVTTFTDGTTDITATSTADPTKNDTIALTVNPPGALRWTRQFGTSSNDTVLGITIDATGNTYIAGYMAGALEGPSAGGTDAFVRTYDGNGNLRWTRQFGTSSNDSAIAIASDGNGNIYATGDTLGALEGVNAGGRDAYVRSYDSGGNLRWTRQFGTTSNDVAYAIATDADGNVYAAGVTFGTLEGASAGLDDAFIRSYDSNGNLRWTRQFGTSGGDYALGVTTDADGRTYTAGYTGGALEGASVGFDDAFIRSYDSNGNLRWTRQFGTSGADVANAITTDVDGSTYTAGYTGGALEGPNAGGTDAFVRSYDGSGNLRWTRQFGTSSSDYGRGVTGDADGNISPPGTPKATSRAPTPAWTTPSSVPTTATATSAGPASSAPAATTSRTRSPPTSTATPTRAVLPPVHSKAPTPAARTPSSAPTDADERRRQPRHATRSRSTAVSTTKPVQLSR